MGLRGSTSTDCGTYRFRKAIENFDNKMLATTLGVAQRVYLNGLWSLLFPKSKILAAVMLVISKDEDV